MSNTENSLNLHSFNSSYFWLLF